MKDFWDKRYEEKGYVYGSSPNEYYKTKIDSLKPGKVLFPAEGEGRNAVYSATKGWEVTACDWSKSGKDKAMNLAAKEGVNLEYNVCSIEEFNAPKKSFDLLVLIYAHFPADLRSKFHKHLWSMVKPGGHLILEAFSKRHIEYSEKNPQAGGPKNKEMLFTEELVKEDFKNLEILELEETIIHLKEGRYHVGESAVIRAFGVKSSN